MKRVTALLIVLSVCACLIGGCAGGSAPTNDITGSVEIIVFAAASMTETLEEIGKAYMEANPNVELQDLVKKIS